MTLTDWIARLDDVLHDRIGVRTAQLPAGLDYAGLWMDGFTPDEVAQLAIEHLAAES
jgi:hypothetical protein